MIPLILISLALAQDTGDPQVEQAPQAVQVEVQKHQVEVLKISDSISAMKAFLRDEIMRQDGFAPAGWETPALEVYEASPDRPSFLPLESVVNATAAGKAEPGLLAVYTSWLTAQTEKTPPETP